MIRRRKPEWQRLISGLYVPPFLHFGDPYPCPDCCVEECEHCSGGNIPNQIDVTFTGITAQPCAQCPTIQGPYTTDFLYEAAGICHWGYTFPTPICEFESVRVEISDIAVAAYLQTTTALYVKWSKSVSAPHDCLNWTNYDLPDIEGSFFVLCDIGNSTCEITSL